MRIRDRKPTLWLLVPHLDLNSPVNFIRLQLVISKLRQISATIQLYPVICSRAANSDSS